MPNEFRTYRASKDGKSGVASKWQLTYKQDRDGKYGQWMIFLNLAQQKGFDKNDNAAFGWKPEDGGITVKLGENDIGELISVLEGRKLGLGTEGTLYHESPGGGSKIIYMTSNEKGFY